MARNISRLTSVDNAYAEATLVNAEGFKGFDRPVQDRYLQLLMTNTVNNTFYVDAKELADESHELNRQIMKEDPFFAVKAIVYARNEGFMRLQPILGLLYLSTLNSQDTTLRRLFQLAFPLVIRTPGDLQDFVELAHKGDVRGLGRSVRREIRNWLNGMSEYHALKYATGGQGFALRDILRLTHPKAKDEKQDAIFKWLTGGNVDFSLIPQIDVYDNLKHGDVSPEAAIKDGRLPHEVVTGLGKMSVPAWQALAKEMPYFALLRHLVTLKRQKALDDELCGFITAKLTSEGAREAAKVSPFRVYSAIQQFEANTAGEQRVLSALWDILELCRIPDIPGRVCIAPDVSGSMWSTVSDRGSTRYIDIAALFAAALMKQNQKNSILMPFDGDVRRHNITGRSLVDTLNQIIATSRGGATAVSAPISKMLDERILVDHFIGITDGVEWTQDYLGGWGFLPAWKEYTKKINPNAKAWLIRIDPYQSHMTRKDEPGVSTIYGWSELVLKYIGRDQDAQVKAVQSAVLDENGLQLDAATKG